MGNHFTGIDEKMPAAEVAVGRFYATLFNKFGYNNLIYIKAHTAKLILVVLPRYLKIQDVISRGIFAFSKCVAARKITPKSCT